jgi:GWxTD domain-containing protein
LRRHAFNVSLAFVLAVSAAGLQGCISSSGIDSEIAGRTLVYQPGIPNFDLEAIATLRGDETGIDLYIGIPYASLIFLQQGNEFVARYEAFVQLQDGEGKVIFSEFAWADTVRVTDYSRTQQYAPMIIERRFEAEPGEYIVRAVVYDANSEESAERRQRLDVIGRLETGFALSRMRVEGLDSEGPFEPIVSYHVPARLDSIRSVVELYNAPINSDVEIGLVLVRYPTDTSVASPPYWLTPPIGSLPYRGVDFSSPDTLQFTRRVLREVDQDVTIEFDFPALDRGMYRVYIQATIVDPPPTEGEDGVLLRRQRNLSIKGEDFPHLTRLNEVVEALRYIAHDRELEEIQMAPTVEEKRKEFDGFWGNLVSNRQQAASLIKQYYGRIEEANLFFTGHKEGWKTDRGMIYVILGPPMYIEYSFDAQIWHYSYSEQDFVNSFRFQRVRPFGAEADFDHYILTRRPYYERMWTRMIERWREGII